MFVTSQHKGSLCNYVATGIIVEAKAEPGLAECAFLEQRISDRRVCSPEIQFLETHHCSLTVHQDTAGQSGACGELDEPEIPSQATHTPSKETAGQQGDVTEHRLRVLGQT